MRWIAITAVLSAALLPAPTLAQASLSFDGERYIARGDARRAPVPLVEYVRPGESLANWTKLVAIRHFANLDDPKAAAANLARTVRQHNPNARADVIAKNDGREAIVDFITWAQGDDRLEFNVHRYRRIDSVPGLVAYQFAWRFRTAELDDATRTVSANRRRWIDAMTKADFGFPFAAPARTTPADGRR